MKKMVSALLAMIMVLAIPVSVLAATNGHSREEAVAKAIAMYKNPYDYDGVYGVQCVDMAVGYYRYLVGYSVSGNGCDYRSNKLPSGWKRYWAGETTPEPGDVVVWSPGMYWVSSKYGHVGVVVDVDDTYFHYVDYNSTFSNKDDQGYKIRKLNQYACVIRPDWDEAPALIANGTYTLTPACAPNARLDISGGSTAVRANVQIYTNNGTDAQKWDITSLGNGYYQLIAKCSGKALDACDVKDPNRRNVIQDAPDGASYQQWKFKDAGKGYYYLIPRYNEGCCLDVYSAESADGTNVQVYTANQSDAQKWKLTSADQESTQPVNETSAQSGYWGPWSDWLDSDVSASDTRQVDVRQVEDTPAHTEYRYGGYVYYDNRRHECWCETYMKKIFGGATLRYSDWSTTRYSPGPVSWTCGDCKGNHIGVDHYSNEKPCWHEYLLPDGDYYWEETRTIAATQKTQYRYRDWISN